MAIMDEKVKFENNFSNTLVEIAAVTGPSGIGAGRAGDDQLWTASIELIAWKDINSSEPAVREEVRLQWLVTDEEWEQSKKLLDPYSIIKVKVRQSQTSMMLVEIVEAHFKEQELETILGEAQKPVYYDDELLGRFELDKRVKSFDAEKIWGNYRCHLTFDYDENKENMASALRTAQLLFSDQNNWDTRMKKFASCELLELANDWLDNINEEITSDMFTDRICITNISVYPGGDFTIFFEDGDLFLGHTIIVAGNIDGTFESAEIAG